MHTKLLQMLSSVYKCISLYVFVIDHVFVCFQCPLWLRYWSPPSIVLCRRELQTSVLHSPALPKVKETFSQPLLL